MNFRLCSGRTIPISCPVPNLVANLAVVHRDQMPSNSATCWIGNHRTPVVSPSRLVPLGLSRRRLDPRVRRHLESRFVKRPSEGDIRSPGFVLELAFFAVLKPVSIEVRRDLQPVHLDVASSLSSPASPARLSQTSALAPASDVASRRTSSTGRTRPVRFW